MNGTGPTPKKRPSRARGVKALITAGAVAATLGGWAALSVAGAEAGTSPAPAAPVAAQSTPAPQAAPPAFNQGRRARGGFAQPGGASPFGGSQAPVARTRSSR